MLKAYNDYDINWLQYTIYEYNNKKLERNFYKMIKLYGYTKCSTVKKAKNWLKENNLEFEDIDMVQNPPSKEELKSIYKTSGYDIKKFFNTSGMKYRELGLKDIVKTESDDKLLEILVSDGMLIKRPLLLDGKNVLLGFKEDVWKSTLLKEDQEEIGVLIKIIN